jgi:hypothetical protein
MNRKDLEIFAGDVGVELKFDGSIVYIKASTSDSEYSFMEILTEIIRNNPDLNIDTIRQTTWDMM